MVFLNGRFLAAVLRSSVSVSWAEALLHDEILSRVLWIVGNTLNSTLFEKVQYNTEYGVYPWVITLYNSKKLSIIMVLLKY